MRFYVVITSFIKLSFAFLFVLFLSTKTFGQTKVYATNYGGRESGNGVAGLTSAGKVFNPANAVVPNVGDTNFAELNISGLLGNAYAELQLKFINGSQNLPAGTSVYVRLDNTTSQGLLGLLGASSGFVSAYKDAPSGNTNTSSTGGTVVALSNSDVALTLIGGQQYIVITPKQCFNSVRFVITSAGLLGLLSNASLKIYDAYYICPTITVPTPTPICAGSSRQLTISNPNASCTTYSWYNVASGGTALGMGTSFNTGALSSTQTFYVEASSTDVSCGRTAVTVTVNNINAGIISGSQLICSGAAPTSLSFSSVASGSGTLSYQWQSSTGGAYSNISGATSSTYNPPSLTTITSYRCVVTSILSSLSCNATSNVVTITVNSLPTFVLAENPTICRGETIAVLTYGTVTGSPITYSINWDSAAITAGLVSLTDKSLLVTINVTVPAGITAGIYNGIVRVKNNNSCESNNYPFTITVYPKPGYPDLSILATD